MACLDDFDLDLVAAGKGSACNRLKVDYMVCRGPAMEQVVLTSAFNKHVHDFATVGQVLLQTYFVLSVLEPFQSF